MAADGDQLEFADDIALLTHRLQHMNRKKEDLRPSGERVKLKMNITRPSRWRQNTVMTKQDGSVNTGKKAVVEIEKF